jgi:hypothetical protein
MNAYKKNEGRYVKVSIPFFKNQLLHWMLAFDQKRNEIVAFLAASVFSFGLPTVGYMKSSRVKMQLFSV